MIVNKSDNVDVEAVKKYGKEFWSKTRELMTGKDEKFNYPALTDTWVINIPIIKSSNVEESMSDLTRPILRTAIERLGRSKNNYL